MRRRDALRAAAAVTAGYALAGCGQPHRSRTAHGNTAVAGPVPPSATRSPRLGALPAEVVHGDRTRPLVALTFHGQGEAALVIEALAALAAGGARATVLGVGSWLGEQPESAHRILDGGHELGNHTQNHLSITDLDEARALAEIADCAEVLRGLTGSVGVWFRPSQTRHASPAIQSYARRIGYPTCLSYDLDSLDHLDPGPESVVRNTLGAIGNGSIVSLHLGHPGTVAAIAPILDGLRGRGLQAVTMTELMAA